jgi:hypothetical protein
MARDADPLRRNGRTIDRERRPIGFEDRQDTFRLYTPHRFGNDRRRVLNVHQHALDPAPGEDVVSEREPLTTRLHER